MSTRGVYTNDAQASGLAVLKEKLGRRFHEDQVVKRMGDIAEKLVAPYQLFLIIDGKSGNIDLEWGMAGIFREVLELWKKQLDYGTQNFAGERSVATRANDKIQRLLFLEGAAAVRVRGHYLGPGAGHLRVCGLRARMGWSSRRS